MNTRLNSLLIGKIRHNLKTYINIISGFSELLIEELMDESNYHQDHKLEPKLQKIADNGAAIAAEIDQALSSQNFTLDEFFSQLSSQSVSLWSVTGPLLKNVSEQLLSFSNLAQTEFVNDFSIDFDRVRDASNELETSITRLIYDEINSIESLLTLGILSQSDLDTVESFSDSLRDAPNVVDTKYPSNILIVDDNPSNTEYLRRKLQTARHNVTVCNEGSSAESRLQSGEAVDLILLDLLMPGMSGYDFLGRNKDILKRDNIPVIVVSSLDEQETVYRCLESGAEDYVTKPINFMILTARINSALERKYLQDREEEHLRNIEEEKKKNEKLLLNILPKSIANRMKENQAMIADTIEECSILFADIVGFTPLSQKLNAETIVTNLNDIFSHFDELCEEIGVEKIKTMGDAYMVACGIPETDRSHASKLADLSFKMLDYIKALPEIDGHKVSIRIGLHSGAAVAGVIGKNKFVYDLWGDAVNTACRMESHGIPNQIHISGDTAGLLKNSDYNLIERAPMEIKGKGVMKTFILDRHH